MKISKRLLMGGIMALLLCLTIAAFAAPTEFASWRGTVSGGGQWMNGGSYTLQSAAGQPEAANASSGGSYSLNGGFLVGDAADSPSGNYLVYLPVVVR